MGVGDHDWLATVRDHHRQAPGRLADRTRPQRLARLIQRADMFAARFVRRAKSNMEVASNLHQIGRI